MSRVWWLGSKLLQETIVVDLLFTELQIGFDRYRDARDGRLRSVRANKIDAEVLVRLHAQLKIYPKVQDAQGYSSCSCDRIH